MAELPKHYIRADDDQWAAGQAKAKEQGTTLSALFRDWLADYIDDVSPIPRAIVGAELESVINHLTALRGVVIQQKGLS